MPLSQHPRMPSSTPSTPTRQPSADTSGVRGILAGFEKHNEQVRLSASPRSKGSTGNGFSSPRSTASSATRSLSPGPSIQCRSSNNNTSGSGGTFDFAAAAVNNGSGRPGAMNVPPSAPFVLPTFSKKSKASNQPQEQAPKPRLQPRPSKQPVETVKNSAATAGGAMPFLRKTSSFASQRNNNNSHSALARGDAGATSSLGKASSFSSQRSSSNNSGSARSDAVATSALGKTSSFSSQRSSSNNSRSARSDAVATSALGKTASFSSQRSSSNNSRSARSDAVATSALGKTASFSSQRSSSNNTNSSNNGSTRSGSGATSTLGKASSFSSQQSGASRNGTTRTQSSSNNTAAEMSSSSMFSKLLVPNGSHKHNRASPSSLTNNPATTSTTKNNNTTDHTLKSSPDRPPSRTTKASQSRMQRLQVALGSGAATGSTGTTTTTNNTAAASSSSSTNTATLKKTQPSAPPPASPKRRWTTPKSSAQDSMPTPPQLSSSSDKATSSMSPSRQQPTALQKRLATRQPPPPPSAASSTWTRGRRLSSSVSPGRPNMTSTNSSASATSRNSNSAPRVVRSREASPVRHPFGRPQHGEVPLSPSQHPRSRSPSPYRSSVLSSPRALPSQQQPWSPQQQQPPQSSMSNSSMKAQARTAPGATSSHLRGRSPGRPTPMPNNGVSWRETRHDDDHDDLTSPATTTAMTRSPGRRLDGTSNQHTTSSSNNINNNNTGGSMHRTMKSKGLDQKQKYYAAQQKSRLQLQQQNKLDTERRKESQQQQQQSRDSPPSPLSPRSHRSGPDGASYVGTHRLLQQQEPGKAMPLHTPILEPMHLPKLSPPRSRLPIRRRRPSAEEYEFGSQSDWMDEEDYDNESENDPVFEEHDSHLPNPPPSQHHRRRHHHQDDYEAPSQSLQTSSSDYDTDTSLSRRQSRSVFGERQPHVVPDPTYSMSASQITPDVGVFFNQTAAGVDSDGAAPTHASNPNYYSDPHHQHHNHKPKDDDTYDYGAYDDNHSQTSLTYEQRRQKQESRTRQQAAQAAKAAMAANMKMNYSTNPANDSSSNHQRTSPLFAHARMSDDSQQQSYDHAFHTPLGRTATGVAVAATMGCLILGPIGLLVGTAAAGIGMGYMQIPTEQRQNMNAKASEAIKNAHDSAVAATEAVAEQCAGHYRESGLQEHVPAEIKTCCTSLGVDLPEDAYHQAVGGAGGGSSSPRHFHEFADGGSVLEHDPMMEEPDGTAKGLHEPRSSPMSRVREKKKGGVACLRKGKIIPVAQVHSLEPSEQPRAWLDVLASAETSWDEKIEATEEVMLLAKDKQKSRLFVDEGILDCLLWTVGRYLEKRKRGAGSEYWAFPNISRGEAQGAKLAASCCLALGKSYCAAIHTEGDLLLMSLYDRGTVPEERQLAQMLHEVPHHTRSTKTEDPTIISPGKEVFTLQQMTLPQAEELSAQILELSTGGS